MLGQYAGSAHQHVVCVNLPGAMYDDWKLRIGIWREETVEWKLQNGNCGRETCGWETNNKKKCRMLMAKWKLKLTNGNSSTETAERKLQNNTEEMKLRNGNCRMTTTKKKSTEWDGRMDIAENKKLAMLCACGGIN